MVKWALGLYCMGHLNYIGHSNGYSHHQHRSFIDIHTQSHANNSYQKSFEGCNFAIIFSQEKKQWKLIAFDESTDLYNCGAFSPSHHIRWQSSYNVVDLHWLLIVIITMTKLAMYSCFYVWARRIRVTDVELLQYILRNMHTVLLCFALLWLCNRS